MTVGWFSEKIRRWRWVGSRREVREIDGSQVGREHVGKASEAGENRPRRDRTGPGSVLSCLDIIVSL